MCQRFTPVSFAAKEHQHGNDISEMINPESHSRYTLLASTKFELNGLLQA